MIENISKIFNSGKPQVYCPVGNVRLNTRYFKINNPITEIDEANPHKVEVVIFEGQTVVSQQPTKEEAVWGANAEVMVKCHSMGCFEKGCALRRSK